VLSGNRGEWSEIYTFFKLLSDGKLHAANADLSLDPNSYYPIVKIIRQQKSFTFEYVLDGMNVSITKNNDNAVLRTINRDALATATVNLLSAINQAKATFEVPAVDAILNQCEITSLKEPHSDKGDISLVAHDSKVNQDKNFAFSIKSQLGSASTLLNASGATNFKFGIIGKLSDTEIETLNLLGPKDLLRDLTRRGFAINLVEIYNEQFEANLKMIDSLMPKIVAEIMLAYYSGNGTSLAELVDIVIADDVLDYGKTAAETYSHKIKTLLMDVALGMTPSKPWSGNYDATGGYIIVKHDGEIVCFHAYNREEFKNYLLASTKMETASRSRHNFGHIYREGSELRIDLNLQIRFI
jgi:type II restriction enzyme